MTPFDRIVVVDWSARSSPSPRAESADAIWIGVAGADTVSAEYKRTRADAYAALKSLLSESVARSRRALVGLDFALGYPAGFAEGLTGRRDPLAVWDWLADRLADSAQNRNTRFAVADAINAGFPGVGPFWGRPKARRDLAHLHWGKAGWDAGGLSEWREVERLAPGARSVWQLLGNGSVGSQSLTGMPVLAALRRHFAGRVAVWPFEPPDKPIVLAEVWPSLLSAEVAVFQRRTCTTIKDKAQVTLLAQALMAAQTDGDLPAMFDAAKPAQPQAAEEGWILGVGAEAALSRAARRVSG